MSPVVEREVGGGGGLKAVSKGKVIESCSVTAPRAFCLVRGWLYTFGTTASNQQKDIIIIVPNRNWIIIVYIGF